jgi:hypothetical protein
MSTFDTFYYLLVNSPFSAMVVIRETVPPEEWEHDDYLNDQKDAEREETMAPVLHTIPVLSSSQVLSALILKRQPKGFAPDSTPAPLLEVATRLAESWLRAVTLCS